MKPIKLLQNINYFLTKHSKIFDILLLITLAISSFLFLVNTGNIDDGYHLTDDHEIIRINNDLKQSNFIDIANKWITDDFKIRYRPIYFAHRVLEAEIFHDNLFYWSLWTGILMMCSIIFFYLGIRRFDFSKLSSVLFVILIFVGPQFAVWWRLGPNETIGMFLLSISFLTIKNKSNSIFLNIIFSISLILTSLAKESFTVIVPAFIFLRIFSNNDSFKESLRKNWMLIFPILVFMFNIYMILFVVGTDKIGYAGNVNQDTILQNAINLINGQINNIFNLYITLFIVTSVVCLYNNKSFRFILKKEFYVPVLFSLLIILPNIYLYLKPGMTERYLLPSTLGFAFLIIAFFNILINIKDNLVYRIFIIIAVSLTIFCWISSYYPNMDLVAKNFS